MMVSCGDYGSKRHHDGSNLGVNDTKTRFGSIVAISDPVERTQEWVLFLRDLDPADADGVGALFSGSIGRVDEAMAIVFGDWWAATAPLAALQTASSWPWDQERLGVRVVLRRWAADDSKAAFAILPEMPLLEQADLQNATRALSQGFFDAEPAPRQADLGEVLTLLKPIPDPKSRNVAFDALLSGMTSRWGIDETERFVEMLPDGPHAGIYRDFSRRFVSALAGVDPVRAVGWVEEVAPGPEGKFLRRRVAARWARSDGASAMTWVLGQPSEEDRDDLVEHTYRRFVQADNNAAIDWMRENVDEVRLEPALPLFIGRMASEQPAQAAEWLDRVSDPEGRRIAAMNVARGWLRRDEDAARDWLPESGLSSRDLARVLREVQPPK